MRVFVDTNVLVSALTTRGLCADLFRVIVTEHDVLIGEVVLAELRRVLRDRFAVPEERLTETEAFLRTFEVVSRPEAPARKVKRDESDDWILQSAVDARADILVTGDSDLLDLKNTSPLRVLSPRSFWDSLRVPK